MPSPLATSFIAAGAVVTALSPPAAAILAALGVLVELLLFVWTAASTDDHSGPA